MLIVKIILAILIAVVFAFGNFSFVKFIDKFNDAPFTLRLKEQNNIDKFWNYYFLMQMSLLILGILFGIFM